MTTVERLIRAWHIHSRLIPYALLASIASTGIEARLWVVSSSGVDSASCGSYASPCRSISQAIDNASDGDEISVGIGRYGDVSGTGNFTSPGDERPGPMTVIPPVPFVGCVICIDKALKITSFAGAAETVIQGNPSATAFPTVVGIQVGGVTLGTPGHGFTISGGKYGVGIAENCTDMVKNVSVAGNVALNDSTGFEFAGYYGGGSGICTNPAALVQISNNTAMNNASGGFVIIPSEFGNHVWVQKNLAMGSANAGFTVSPGSDHGDPSIYAGNVSLLYNVATQNRVGFSLAQVGTAQHNTATNNIVAGFVLDADLGFNKAFTIFSYNAAMANRGPGVIVNPTSRPPGPGFADLSHNDFIGNDRNRTVTVLIPGYLNIGPSAHCGLLNTGFASGFFGLGPVGGKLQSVQDFWGIPQGPKANGPGDNAGGVCDKNGAVTTAVPFSTSAYVFTSLALLVQ